jgi:hypothetical protein
MNKSQPRKYLYTFSQQENQFPDSRFKLRLASRILANTEVEQVKETIDATFKLFNDDKLPTNLNQFISKQMRESIA